VLSTGKPSKYGDDLAEVRGSYGEPRIWCSCHATFAIVKYDIMQNINALLALLGESRNTAAPTFSRQTNVNLLSARPESTNVDTGLELCGVEENVNLLSARSNSAIPSYQRRPSSPRKREGNVRFPTNLHGTLSVE